MKKNQNSMPDEMLVKYLLGELTSTEKEEVLQWINASKENKDYCNDLKLIWKESIKLAPANDTDTDDAWMRFTNRVQSKGPAQVSKRRVYPLGWLKAAAILVLLAGSGSVAWYMMKQNNTPPVAVQTSPETDIKDANTPSIQTPVNPVSTATAQPQIETPHNSEVAIKNKPGSAPKIYVPKKQIASKSNWQPLKVNDSWLQGVARTKEFICNGTPCPIEICIIQMIRCDQGQPSTIASCSTLQPDQAGQLHFKALDNVVSDCNATIEEIRIKRITTGETIVLNKESKPATAQDLFNYLTGQKQGEILAGVFQADCNDRCNENSLRLGKDFGHLIFQ